MPQGSALRSSSLLMLACALLLGGCGAHEERAPAAGGEVSSAAALRAGLDLFRQGDLKAAEPLLAAALRSSPRDRRLHEALGSIYARSNRWRQAEESFRAALLIEPASIGARLGLAAAWIDTGRYDEAAGMLAEVRRLDPENPSARLKGALLDARLGRAADAEAGARAVIARQPSSAEAHYILGLALEQKGALREAAAEMRLAQNFQPAHLGALSHLVTLATRLGKTDETARWRAAQVEALSRAHVEERVRDHRIKGVAAFNREDYNAALQEFQVIAREDPLDPQIHLHLGSTHIALGDLEEAKRELRRCLELEPRNDRALAELGRAEALSNHLEEAIEALTRAITVNPQFAEPHYYLAGIYRARGEQDRYREEMKIFADLRSRSPGSALEVQAGETP